MRLDKLDSLMYDEDVKDNYPIILRGEGRLNLVGERLGWTVQYRVEYKNEVISSYSAYDYGDALERAVKTYEKYLTAIKTLEVCDISVITKIDNINKRKI